jgi:hypothetical protein
VARIRPLAAAGAWLAAAVALLTAGCAFDSSGIGVGAGDLGEPDAIVGSDLPGVHDRPVAPGDQGRDRTGPPPDDAADAAVPPDRPEDQGAPPDVAADPGGPPDQGADAAADVTADPPAPDMAAPPPACPPDAALVACFPFEGNTTDQSMGGLNSATTGGNVTFTAGQFGQALRTGSGSVIIPQSRPLHGVTEFTTELTLQMWARPSSLHAGRNVLLDNDFSFTAWVEQDGSAVCQVTDATLVDHPLSSPAGQFSAGSWNHLACRYDGATLKVYVDGVERGSLMLVTTISSGGTEGTGIGSYSDGTTNRFDGAIDNLRIWNVARTPSEILADAAPP